ncbi:hypothetical protein E4T48_07122 [Aureobasidium sp. EXF-10727]|nr:hypothetical protein E4T48_07122 [Aureobasidium sp. EXF-10727]
MEKLQNDDMRTVLDAVDDLRAVGINSIIPLPQIVASLLEALTGIPFPRDTGLCTRFATQFILRRADKVSISVTIIPGPNRVDQDERQRLEAFGRGKTFDPTKLGELIEDATRVMGLPSLTGDPKNIRAFSHDVLSIAISGPDRPSLTLVDTPGLIKSKGKYQSVEDIKTIETLVKSYINQDSTILLSVLSATYQRELQQIPSMITENAAIRTLGIITKPDGPGTDTALEREYIELAQNQLLPLGHGWHVVKNRGFPSTRSQDGLAAEDALTVSWVYYRSQREHFVAYLTKHIIEPCMVEGLDKILSPKEFGSMPITETRSLAVEAEELVEERKQLLRKKQILEKGKAKFDAALDKKDGHTKVEPELE